MLQKNSILLIFLLVFNNCFNYSFGYHLGQNKLNHKIVQFIKSTDKQTLLTIQNNLENDLIKLISNREVQDNICLDTLQKCKDKFSNKVCASTNELKFSQAEQTIKNKSKEVIENRDFHKELEDAVETNKIDCQYYKVTFQNSMDNIEKDLKIINLLLSLVKSRLFLVNEDIEAKEKKKAEEAARAKAKALAKSIKKKAISKKKALSKVKEKKVKAKSKKTMKKVVNVTKVVKPAKQANNTNNTNSNTTKKISKPANNTNSSTKANKVVTANKTNSSKPAIITNTNANETKVVKNPANNTNSTKNETKVVKKSANKTITSKNTTKTENKTTVALQMENAIEKITLGKNNILSTIQNEQKVAPTNLLTLEQQQKKLFTNTFDNNVNFLSLLQMNSLSRSKLKNGILFDTSFKGISKAIYSQIQSKLGKFTNLSSEKKYLLKSINELNIINESLLKADNNLKDSFKQSEKSCKERLVTYTHKVARSEEILIDRNLELLKFKIKFCKLSKDNLKTCNEISQFCNTYQIEYNEEINELKDAILLFSKYINLSDD